MLKKTLKIIVFTICAILLMVLAIRVLRFKSQDGIDQMHAFYENEENTVDVLFLGSSHMYSNVNTGLLWSDYGIAAYDLGAAEQPFWNTYYFMQEALKTQKPKVIVAELYSAAIQKTHFQGAWTLENLFGMNFNKNFVDSVKLSIMEDEQSDYINQFARYHSRYSMITKDDFIYDRQMEIFKGFDPKFGTEPLGTPSVAHVTELSPPNEKMADYMIQMIDLAKAEGIPILLVCAPYGITEEQQKIFNCFYQYADENDVPYIDFNVCYEEVGIDFSQDFKEWSHLNEKGNAKYTRYLGEYLKANYELEDHRGDPAYVSWDQNAELLEHELKAYQLKNSPDLASYLDFVGSEDYVVMLAARNVENVSTIPEQVLQGLQTIGLDQDTILQDGNVFYRNGVVEYEHKGKNFEWFTEQNKNDFCMERVHTYVAEGESGEYMHDVSKIIVDGKNYYQNGYAFNIVVYDKVLEQVIDAIGVKNEEGMPFERTYAE